MSFLPPILVVGAGCDEDCDVLNLRVETGGLCNTEQPRSAMSDKVILAATTTGSGTRSTLRPEGTLVVPLTVSQTLRSLARASTGDELYG